MPLIAATALQVFPQQFPFFFSLWAWGEVQLVAHMLGIHALLVLPPGCGCSGPFVLTLPLFMAGISPAAWKMETQAPTHLFPPKSVSEERTLFFVAPMTNGLLVSTAEVHYSEEENKLIHAWSCEVLWLFVNWVKGKTYRKQGNVCLQTQQRVVVTNFIQDEYCFHTLLSIFSSCFVLIMNSFPYMQDIENIT